MMGLPYGEQIMIVGRTMWTQSTSVTDRQTDGRTDGQTDGQNYYHKDRATQRSHGKNVQKDHYYCGATEKKQMLNIAKNMVQ